MIERGDIILGDKRRYRRSSRKIGRRLGAALVVTIAISYVFWAMGSIDERTRIRQALVDISRIEHAARLFRTDHDRCPDSIEELASPPGEGKYLELKPDPWGQPYQFVCPAASDPDGVEVISGGPDRNPKGEDNISSLLSRARRRGE
ncbi:MAG: hypothetical protein GY847_05310 [Proteobacteria bacterium]|nr:hypothetical protein [Pseudomonadota bacterium]